LGGELRRCRNIASDITSGIRAAAEINAQLARPLILFCE